MALRSKYNLLESNCCCWGKLKGMSDKQLKEHLSNIISLKPVTHVTFYVIMTNISR